MPCVYEASERTTIMFEKPAADDRPRVLRKIQHDLVDARMSLNCARDGDSAVLCLHLALVVPRGEALDLERAASVRLGDRDLVAGPVSRMKELEHAREPQVGELGWVRRAWTGSPERL